MESGVDREMDLAINHHTIGEQMIKDEGLRAYAELLHSNGFAVYEPKGRSGDYFTYSRVVDGRECFGTVSESQEPHLLRALGRTQDAGYEHRMPIEPSREHGSSMFVEINTPLGFGVTRRTSVRVIEGLTIEAAELVARPSNGNHLVGTQYNWREYLGVALR